MTPQPQGPPIQFRDNKMTDQLLERTNAAGLNTLVKQYMSDYLSLLADAQEDMVSKNDVPGTVSEDELEFLAQFFGHMDLDKSAIKMFWAMVQERIESKEMQNSGWHWQVPDPKKLVATLKGMTPLQKYALVDLVKKRYCAKLMHKEVRKAEKAAMKAAEKSGD